MEQKNYTAIHVHSDLSLLDSCTAFEQYVDRAVELGQKAIASTEHGKPLQWVQKKMYCDSNLMDMSHQRMCSRAYHEYRRLFDDVCAALRAYSEEWAYLVDNYFMPKCEYFGFCQEKKSCGRKERREGVIS